jgi:hypothetical protein
MLNVEYWTSNVEVEYRKAELKPLIDKKSRKYEGF